MNESFSKTPPEKKETLFRAMLEHLEEGHPIEELQVLLVEYFKNMPEKKHALDELLQAAEKINNAYQTITRLEKELPEL